MGTQITENRQVFLGHIVHRRNHGGIVFLLLRWGSETYQLVCCKDIVSSCDFQTIKHLKCGDFIKATAEKKDEDWKVVQLLQVVPFLKQARSVSNSQLDLMLAYSWLLQSIRGFLSKRGYVEVRLPSIHFGAHKKPCFLLNFFGHPARLTTSNALYLNIMALNLGKVFSLQPVFRAEPSHTFKHLAEFDLLEAACLGGSMEVMMELLEEMLQYLLMEARRMALPRLCPPDDISTPLSRIPYEQIALKYQILGHGLGRYERQIAQHSPIFVTDFLPPLASWSAKLTRRGVCRSFNLLLPGVGEAAEGNEKETSVELLIRKVRHLHLEKELGWYIKHFRHSGCPLAGFGLGVERLAMWLFRVNNIRQLRPFFRDNRFPEITHDHSGETLW